MDSFDFNTRLPPRKRLLAGLKKDSSDCEFQLPVPPISRDLYARLHDLFNSTASSPEEIIEASRSAALAAAEVAAGARATAIEKAAAAVKAGASARSALELLDSIARNEARREGCLARNKLRKKHVPVKLLYKNNRPVEVRETDEELAKRLHRAMNSSPRISNNSNKKHGGHGKAAVCDDNVVCDGNSPVLGNGDVKSVNGHYVDKFEEKVLVCSKADLSEKEGGCGYIEKHHHASRDRGIAGGKKAKVKRKKLPLSQCNTRDLVKHSGKTLTGESKLDCADRNEPLDDAKPSCEGEVSMTIASVWKCKKLKVSQRSSESKISHTLYAHPTATMTSAVVKVD